MSQIIQQGDLFSFAPSQDSMLNALPGGNYILVSTANGWVFQRQEPFKPLAEIYGDHEKVSQRIYRSFKERSGNTGVLLAGTKGSGKSFLGRLLSQRALEDSLPTILITEPIDGETLRYMLSQLDHPAVVLIDEFEKVYDNPKMQLTFLSLLDGLSTTKHLFILTVNDVERVDTHMKNRPGRLYYLMEFHGLDEQFIREYAEAKLENQEHLEELLELSSYFHEFNFDMLSSLVEEMNRFDESPREAVRLLNISPVGNLEGRYFVSVTDMEGREVGSSGFWAGNPLEPKPLDISVYDGDDEDEKRLAVSVEHMTAKLPRQGMFLYEFEGYKITLRNSEHRKHKSSDHWSDRF